MTLLAISREKQIIPNPDADTRLLINDIIVVLAPPEKLAEMSVLSGTGQALR